MIRSPAARIGLPAPTDGAARESDGDEMSRVIRPNHSSVRMRVSTVLVKIASPWFGALVVLGTLRSLEFLTPGA